MNPRPRYVSVKHLVNVSVDDAVPYLFVHTVRPHLKLGCEHYGLVVGLKDGSCRVEHG